MQRLWIVSELFYPEETSTAYILTQIASGLAGKYEVHVLCGPTDYEEKDKRRTTLILDERIRIHRVSDTKLDKNRLRTRILRTVWLSWKLSLALCKKLKRGDAIFIVTNPASLLILVAFIKKIRHNILHILVHDVFPENTIPARIIRSQSDWLYRISKHVFDIAYRQADQLIVLGRDMQEVMLRKLEKNKHHTKVQVISNWADTELIQPSEKKLLAPFSEDGDAFLDIQYAGNLGRVQGLRDFVSVIGQVKNPQLRFSFWGNGALKNELEGEIKSMGLSNVLFMGNYSRMAQNEVLNSCDMALVTLAEGMYGLGVPSKTYNILAAGKPVLFVGDLRSEIALLIKEYGIGYCFSMAQQSELVAFLSSLSPSMKLQLKEMGRKARMLAECQFTKEYVLGEYCKYV